MSPQSLPALPPPPTPPHQVLTFREQMWFEDFQDGRRGGHFGYRNGTILAILKLHVAQMPPTKFGFNPT